MAKNDSFQSVSKHYFGRAPFFVSLAHHIEAQDMSGTKNNKNKQNHCYENRNKQKL